MQPSENLSENLNENLSEARNWEERKRKGIGVQCVFKCNIVYVLHV